MDALQAAIIEFSSILDLAAKELPRLSDPAARAHGDWTRKQILGHLIDSAANNHQRFVRGQLDAELLSPGYAQEQWVELERFQDREWSDLIQFWLAYNKHLLHLMRHAAADRLATPIRIAGGEPVTLGCVMVDYVRHLKQHLVQIGIAIE